MKLFAKTGASQTFLFKTPENAPIPACFHYCFYILLFICMHLQYRKLTALNLPIQDMDP